MGNLFIMNYHFSGPLTITQFAFHSLKFDDNLKIRRIILINQLKRKIILSECSEMTCVYLYKPSFFTDTLLTEKELLKECWNIYTNRKATKQQEV